MKYLQDSDVFLVGNDHLQRASELWREGQPLEAGRLIFVNLPQDARPKWAARILRLVIDRSGVDTELFAHLLYDADHQSLWRDGHRVFSTLRRATLKLDRLRTKGVFRKNRLTYYQQQLAHVLALAELVAKVTYNAANPPDKFDEDSGWWIVS